MARGPRQPLRPIGAGESRLAQVADLARSLAEAPWFAACGEPLTAAESEEARTYLAGLGLDPLPIDTVPGWMEAAATAQRPDWSRAWWEAEDRAARALQDAAGREIGETQVLAALSAVTEAAVALHGPAALAAARQGIADPVLSRVAAGAAALACHQMGLVQAAGASEDHPLAAKYRLFAGGHWLLGVVGERCYLF